jgi:hypothetical protein
MILQFLCLIFWLCIETRSNVETDVPEVANERKKSPLIVQDEQVI